MTSETFYRIWFWTLILMVFLLFTRVVFSQNPDVSLDVSPKVVTINPYKRVTFRLLIRIKADERNRVVSYSADCGSDARSSEGPADSIAYTHMEELTVTSACYFQACVHRLVDGKYKSYCAYQTVEPP